MKIKSFMSKLVGIIVSCLFCIETFAHDININGIFYNIVSDNTVEVVANPSSYKGNITIPSSVSSSGKDYSVVSIGADAFFACRDLLSVVLPNTITNIGKDAFQQCDKLISISLPNSLTKIGDQAFYNCSALKSIEIPDPVNSLGTSLFWGCTNLISVKLPSSLKTIPTYMFFGCI